MVHILNEKGANVYMPFGIGLHILHPILLLSSAQLFSSIILKYYYASKRSSHDKVAAFSSGVFRHLVLC